MDIQINNIQDERAYLDARLTSVFYDKKDVAKKQFGLVDDKPPADGKETVERILAGKYVIVNEVGSYSGRHSSYIRWRDPAQMEDLAGYDAAKVVLHKVYQNTRDEIRVKPPVDGLEALRAFESTTIN